MTSTHIKNEPAKVYRIDTAGTATAHNDDDDTVRRAIAIVQGRFKPGQEFTGPKDAADYFVLTEPQDGVEHFRVAFLDTQHRIIAVDELARGTIDQAAVYPRDVVKAAFDHNAAAVVLTHNHPSGCVQPSQADKSLTHRLEKALDLLDIRVLDHVVTGHGRSYSFGEHGLLLNQ